LCKRYFSKKLNRELKLKEIFLYGLGFSPYNDFYQERDIVFLDNSPEEIMHAAIEMHNILIGSITYSKKQLEFLNNKVPEFLEIANGIVTSDDFIAKDIKKRFSIKDDKIKLFSIATSAAYQPIYWGDKESVKNSYADGKEYFLFSGDISPRYDLINLLKAFSIFKAKQQSNMQLLITAKSISINDPFNKIFNTYKYRREVQILTGLSEKKLAKITAAAYGFIYPAHSAESALLPLQAMQCDVPVISSPLETLKEKLGDAALYADPSNFEDIAEKMPS
jgi:glycosyltransferase involved in cell wall biosynthesis